MSSIPAGKLLAKGIKFLLPVDNFFLILFVEEVSDWVFAFLCLGL